MKVSFKNSPTIATFLLAAGLAMSLSSCKKDNTSTANSIVTEADAAELTTDAIVPANAGLVLQVNSSVTVYKNVSLGCGVQKDSSISGSSISGVVPAYSYSLNWNYLLNCSTSQFTAGLSGSSSYDGLRMSSTDNSAGSLVLSGLQPSTTAYTLNTSYTRNGSQTSKIGNTNTFASKLTITSSNIAIDKTSLQILSGTASVAITGTSTSGNSFSFSGTVTFLGGNKATLVLNSGASYSISW